MNVTASLAIAWMVSGGLPVEAPTPRLSKVITRCFAAMPSTTRGSQLSRLPARCTRKITGTPVSAPNCRYANLAPPTSTVFVCACLYVVVTVALSSLARLRETPPAVLELSPVARSTSWRVRGCGAVIASSPPVRRAAPRHPARFERSRVRVRVVEGQLAGGVCGLHVLEHQVLAVFRLICHEELGALDVQAFRKRHRAAEVHRLLDRGD